MSTTGTKTRVFCRLIEMNNGNYSIFYLFFACSETVAFGAYCGVFRNYATAYNKQQRDGYSVKELIHFLTFRFQINSCNFTGRLFMTQLSEHFDVLKWLYKMYLEVYCLGGKGVNEELKCV